MTATFKITTKNGKQVKSYEMEFSSYKDLNCLFQEARQVWDEFMVSVEADAVELSASHTWKEEILMNP